MGLLKAITILVVIVGTVHEMQAARYTMNIHEKGKRFQETVEINEKAKLQVYKVPAHNNVDQSEVMQDFKEGLTVYRIPGKRVCYISKLLPGEPKPQKLRSNFQRARSSSSVGPITVVSRSMMPRGPYPRNLLRKEVLDFCGKFEIYRVAPYSDASVTVEGAKGRVKRQANGLKMCKRIDEYTGLTCTMDKILYRCHFQSASCFYTISCKPNLTTLQMCDTVHTWTGFMCCDPYCS